MNLTICNKFCRLPPRFELPKPGERLAEHTWSTDDTLVTCLESHGRQECFVGTSGHGYVHLLGLVMSKRGTHTSYPFIQPWLGAHMLGRTDEQVLSNRADLQINFPLG